MHRYFKNDADAKVVVQEIETIIDNKFEKKKNQLATKEDLDLAMTKGVNYPKGLLQWADEIGLQNIYTTLDVLYELYNEERYRPSILMKVMMKENKKFF